FRDQFIVPTSMALGHSHEHNHHGDHCDDKHDHSHEHHFHHHESVSLKEPDAIEKAHRYHVLRKLKIASFLCLTFLVVEIVGGIISGSLSVLSDAAHLAADLSAYLVAIVGSHIASLPATAEYTFGFQRTESIVALFSMVTLAVMSIGLAVEAVRRMWGLIYSPEDIDVVDGKLMTLLALIGVVVNISLALILGTDHVHMPGAEHGHDHSHDHEHGGCSHGEEYSGAGLLDLELVEVDGHDHDDCVAVASKPVRNVNLHAAYIHALADLAQSVTVLIAGVIIWQKPNWQITDPICTLIFSILVCYSTVGVIKSSLYVLLEKVPPGVHWDEIYSAICAVPGVSNVHELHIWSISHGTSILSVHAVAEDVGQAYNDIKSICNERNIFKLTLQILPKTISEECLS
ncbi:hypothetical protein HJC23_002341, partial [Cyclotella cryptica]